MDEALFNRLKTSVKEAGAIRRGKRAPSRTFDLDDLDVTAIRNDLGETQEEFARMLRVSVSTVRNWEQGRRRPRGPARALLMVTRENPEAVAEALVAADRSD